MPVMVVGEAEAIAGNQLKKGFDRIDKLENVNTMHFSTLWNSDGATELTLRTTITCSVIIIL